MDTFDPHKITKEHYKNENSFHIEKSDRYDWTPQIKEFAEKLPQGARVLDAGSGGSGRDVAVMRKLGLNVECLDYSAEAGLSLLAKFPDIAFHNADLRDTQLPSGNYQGIWACASIVNTPKAEAPIVITELDRILQKRGVLFLSVKKGQGERIMTDVKGERFFAFYSEFELRKLVESVGFKIDRIESVDEGLLTTAPNAAAAWLCLYAVK
jgi:ubiquinone/menaquinone biosynthesis C-methylase UbiE